MKKRLTYHLDIIGHYLLVGWLLFIAITIMVSLLTYIVMDANPTFIHQIVTGLSDKFAEPKDNLRASVGLVMGVYAAKMGLSGALAAFALGILPHGILEMSALIIGVTLAAQVNRALRHSIKRFFSDAHYEKSPLDVKAIALQYVCIVVPMIAVAALIEGFVTPVLLRLIVH